MGYTINGAIGKLQAEMVQLREEADSIKLSRSEISSDILEDARARLQMLQNSVGHRNIWRSSLLNPNS
jgi:hypothetical protein